MVFSIVKQSVDIRLRLALEKTPKLSADTECAVAIGMLAKMAGLALPERRETFEEMMAEVNVQTSDLLKRQNDVPTDDRMNRLAEILFAYEPKNGVDDEKYELVRYGYEQKNKEL